MLLKGRLNGRERTRLGKLLDMLYMPSELAEEVGFITRQIYRVYVPLGCPSTKENGHIWINGKDFAEWYEATYPKQTLLPDEAFCLTCKKAVEMVNPERRRKGRLRYWVCGCPRCGRPLARIIDREKR
ncbi:MAG: hypothetical protein HZB19_15290 [Chloroflexi bacterium]|nr:hypothetical protein [Chloroflexota bacterium]